MTGEEGLSSERQDTAGHAGTIDSRYENGRGRVRARVIRKKTERMNA